MGGVNGNGGDAGIKHGRDFRFGRQNVLLVFNSVMIGVDGNRDRNSHFIAKSVHRPGNIPIVYSTVGIRTAF